MPKARPEANAQAPNGDTTQYRENPKTNEKIDAWIKDHPDQWNFFRSLPPDRAARKLVLNEIDRYERRAKMDNGLLTKLKQNPEALKAYEALVKHLPEGQRERAMVSIARQAFRVTSPRNDGNSKSQGEAVATKVGGGISM